MATLQLNLHTAMWVSSASLDVALALSMSTCMCTCITVAPCFSNPACQLLSLRFPFEIACTAMCTWQDRLRSDASELVACGLITSPQKQNRRTFLATHAPVCSLPFTARTEREKLTRRRERSSDVLAFLLGDAPVASVATGLLQGVMQSLQMFKSRSGRQTCQAKLFTTCLWLLQWLYGL